MNRQPVAGPATEPSPTSRPIESSPSERDTGFLTAAEAAARLGVKPATLYAYVSRGLLRSERGPDGRGSRFRPEEVQQLARRGRHGAANGRQELVIPSALTAITADACYYRGLDAGMLARRRSFEAVAEWLWSGAWPELSLWRAQPEALALATAVQAPLPLGTAPLERLRVVAAAVGTTDPLRYDTRSAAVLVAGRGLLAVLAECLPRLGPGLAADGNDGSLPADALAARLWPRLCPVAPAPGMLEALNAALVLLADHELAASTVAARLAASFGADPYAVVCTGLGALSGPRHGGASLAAEALLAEIATPEEAARLIGERVRRGDRLRCFGQPLYPRGDPRAQVLLDLLRAAAPDSDRLAVVDAVLGSTGERGLPPPNVDFALAALGHVAGFIGGAGEAIFALARAAGWLAHALEAYEQPVWFRPRAVYVGPLLDGA